MKTKKGSMEEALAAHILVDEEFQNKINRVIFGDDPNEKGMKEKVDDMHKILISAQNIGGFFNGIKGILGWLILFGAVLVLLKGWFIGLFAYITR